ncbi:SAF domain-containing protein [Sphaerimonospora mesophila]|uniref:SAF domain-containing protein n=1 Tax=Sphaerimonospora mesophila TaxID=37483 RepID=UPI0006E3229E
MVRTRTHDTVKAPALPRRRRPAMFLLVVVFIGLGVLAGQYAYAQLDKRSSVVVVARDVPIGQVIGQDDLAAVRIAADPMVATVPAGRLSEMVGRVAAVDLVAGTLLADGHTTDAMTPGPGQQLVPLALKPGQLPARGLRAGDHVLVAAEPTDPGQARAGTATKDIPATVDRVGEADPEGTRVVDLLVGPGVGGLIAREAMRGHIALILTSRGDAA